MDYFVWPIVAFLLPLPLLIYLISRYRTGKSPEANGDALHVPFFDRVAPFSGMTVSSSSLWRIVLMTLAWIALVTAGMRPVYYKDEIRPPKEARNIMLVIDLSASMAERDLIAGPYRTSRVAIVKEVVGDFITRRSGDRLGLVVFGNSAHTLAPLSQDLKTLKALFADVDLGIAGEQTAIGDALALAVQDTTKIPVGKKAIILLSDGYSNAGNVTIPEAIELAQKQKIPVYTIGIGPLPRQDGTIFDLLGNGNPAWDEKTLNRIATETGGRYFVAHSARDLEHAYQEIDRLETLTIEGMRTRPRQDIFYYPLGLALLLWLGAMRGRRT